MGHHPHSKQGLQRWFSIWVPAYGKRIVLVTSLAALLGAFVYAENVALGELGKSFAATPSDIAKDPVLRPLAALVHGDALRLPLAVLGAFVVMRLLRAAVDVLNKRETGRLQHLARSDLEKEILDHLLRKDDAFFATSPPAEILNRLSSDITRVIERRTTSAELLESVFLIVGNVYFFLREDWRLALAGAVTCAAGAYVMHRMTYRVQEMDHAYLVRDDHVKATFEDFLRASPEVQVAGLRRTVRTRFEKTQASRREMFLEFTALNARLQAASTVSYLVSFVSLLVIPILFMGNGDVSTKLALVPVVIKALPELFANASQIVFHRLSLQLASTSCDRLLEYDSGPDAAEGIADEAPRVDVPAGALRVDDVTFRYRTESGAMQGGVAGVSTEFPRGAWTAIVGPAGSGKSTLLQLVVGRARPQAGRIVLGERPYEEMTERERARALTLMPQSLAILDTSILENLAFAKDDSHIRDDDFGVIEATDLASICRTKALAMTPSRGNPNKLEARVVELRRKIRARLAADGITATPFENDGDPDPLVIERLIGGRSDRPALVARLYAPAAGRALDAVAASELGAALVAGGEHVVSESRTLLALPTFDEFERLAPAPLDERVWQSRVAALAAIAKDARSRADRRALLRVALTASASEIEVPKRDDPALDPLRVLTSGVCAPLEPTKLHPYLSWRENLVFAHVDAKNARTEGRVDRAILDVLDEEGLGRPFVRIGLSYEVGRGGARLSGGQRQLLALTRALLRRTPVIVLDEPTSALDPRSRARVAEVLRDWSKDRVVITVSHDPDLVRAADGVRLLEAGRLLASGSYDELERQSAAFRDILSS